MGKANEEYVEALWLIDGSCIADYAETYDILFDKLALTVTDLGGEPGNEIGRLNNVDPLRATSLRIRAMWLLDHPAKLFSTIFLAPEPGVFVFNALVSAKKWTSFTDSDIDALKKLEAEGMEIKRVEIPSSSKKNEFVHAVHICWRVSIK